MNATQDSVCLDAGEGVETDWMEAEARFQRAKQALLDIQQQHCAAADELLLARAQVQQMLEAVFPGPDGVQRPVPKRRSGMRGDCNPVVA